MAMCIKIVLHIKLSSELYDYYIVRLIQGHEWRRSMMTHDHLLTTKLIEKRCGHYSYQDFQLVHLQG